MQLGLLISTAVRTLICEVLVKDDDEDRVDTGCY